MRSSAPLYDRLHTRACVRTHSRVFECRGPLNTHFCTIAIECTLMRSIARILSHHVTLFRSLSSLLPLISHLHCTLPPPHLCSHFTQTLTQYLHTPPPPHCRIASTGPISLPFSIIHKTQLFPKFHILPPFFSVQRYKSIHGLSLLLFVLVSYVFARGWG
jgi:hypothetical protein